MDQERKTKIIFWMKENQIEMIDLNLINDALTHSSFKGMGYDVEDNERLEFLGDSVLDLIIAHQLFLHTQLSEEDMTEKRKDLVSNESLATIYDHLNLGQIVRTANDFAIPMKSKAGFVEAIFGAIFMDKGYRRSCEFWAFIDKRTSHYKNKNTEDLSVEKKEIYQKEEDISKFIDDWEFTDQDRKDTIQELAKINKNAKNVLQEYCQKQFQTLPEYDLISREGPDHKPIFTVEVSARVIINEENEVMTATGIGNTKKTAEIKAAEKICDILELKYSS